MSGRIAISFVEFPTFSFDFDRVRCASLMPFLARNWCGCGRLDVATDRPGVGKSMLVEAALEHFLNPAPSVEALMRERLEDMHARFDHLERDMRMIADTVALHARYHLAVMPPVPETRQRKAVVLGNERFEVLAEPSRSPRS
jgi:hypothetical protein